MRKHLLVCTIALFMISSISWAQERKVSGKVTSAEDGSALPGVNVVLKGTTNGTVTDAHGNFTLSGIPASGGNLVFSFIGLSSQEVPIGEQTVVDVALALDVTQLSEVVVTGYGDVQKKKFAGSTVSIGASEVAAQTYGSFDLALQGAAPGVSVVGNSGQPGTNAVVRIRGNGSINGSNTPLYILDGIEISAADFATMNSNDFASFDVLKDAASTAMYGSRGANGVIVITTKKGKAGKLQLEYRGQYGFSKLPESRLDIMNSQQKVDYELQRGNPYGWADEEADSLRLVNFDWEEALFQTGITQDHLISASGGTDKSRFYASLNYFDQEGIVKTTGLKRYTARVNVDNTFNNWIFGLNVQGGFSTRTGTSENNTFLSSPLNAILWSNPYERDKNPVTGEWSQPGGPGYLTSGQPNGAMELFLDHNYTNQVKGVATSYLEFHFPFLDGLYARTNWGIDYTQNEYEGFNDPRTAGAQARNGSLTRSFDRNFRYTGTTSLNYGGNFGDHEISAGLFTEIVKNDYREFGFTGYGFTNGFTNEAGLTAGSAASPNYIPSVSGNGSQNGILSYFANINYGFRGKYYLNLTGRRDGSSRFGVNNRWANFGSIGFSWALSEEAFIKSISVISNLQFKASFGTTGNTGVSNYPIPSFGRTAYGGTSGWVPSAAGNLDLGWETNQSTNVGLVFGLFENRLSGSLEWYNRETLDLFYNIPVDPSLSGFSSVLGNFGQLRNRGVEFGLSGDIVRTKDLKLTLAGNISYNKNMIVELPQDSVISGVTMLAEGHPINSLYLVRFAGVNPDNGNALYLNSNGEETQVYDVNDKVLLGTMDAPWYGGFTLSAFYKGIDASINMVFFLGREMYNNDLNNLTNPGYFYDNMSVELLKEWRNPGDITVVPRPTSSGGNTYSSQTTRFLEDASYWRLRNVSLGYSFPETLLSKAKIRSLRVFMQGQNWLTFTKYRAFDPERVNGVSGAQYPALIQTTFGLQIGF